MCATRSPEAAPNAAPDLGLYRLLHTSGWSERSGGVELTERFLASIRSSHAEAISIGIEHLTHPNLYIGGSISASVRGGYYNPLFFLACHQRTGHMGR